MASEVSFRGRLLSASALASVLSFVAIAAQAGGLPHGGHYVAGHGTLNKAGQSLTVKQSSTTGIIDWNSFSIGRKNGVSFDNGAGATLNRVTGGNLSRIAGSLHATGSLYLMNSSGVIVSGSGRVVTGGSFAASSGNIAGDAFAHDKFHVGKAAVVNRGSIVSSGGVSLLGGNVGDSGTISASSVDLKAAHRLTIGGAITAQNADGSGGALTARARTIVIDASGRIDASAIGTGKTGGTVSIVARDTTEVAGTISADGGARGKGGFIETSGEHLHVADSARISTLARDGATGTWLIDPQDFTIAASGGDITGTTLSGELSSNDITIKSSAGATSGNGDIFVDDAVTWSSGKTLTLDAYRNIIVEAPIMIFGAGSLVLIDADQSGTGVNDGNTADGDYMIDAPVTFTDVVNGVTKGALKINGKSFTLVNSLSQLASDIAANTAGRYALANSYNAHADGTYSASPIPTEFTGTFEGLGNTISNLTIDNTVEDSNVGLFAMIGDGDGNGAVRDIGLVNANVTGSGQHSNVGALVGDNDGGTISDSYATGTVTSGDEASVGGLVGSEFGGTIDDSHATDMVGGGDSSSAGGLVGLSTAGMIGDSYATGAVTDGDGSYAGGLVGYNDSLIGDSYATGAVTGSDADYAGGLVGLNYGMIDESYSTGAATGGSGASVGGFAGGNSGTIGGTTAVYSDSDDNSNPVGSGTAIAHGGGLTLAQMMTASNFSGWTFGTTGSTSGWVIVDGDGSLNNASAAAGGTTPMLLSEYSTSISNGHQLQLMELGLTANYTLAAGIDAGATAGGDVWGSGGFIPVGGNHAPSNFTGTFDGQGFTIANLAIDNTSAGNDDVGLFGDSDGTIGNVTLTGATVTGGSDGDVGILVGENAATIANARTTGSVTVDANANAGGLVGYNVDGTVFSSSSSAAVTGGTSAYVGGLAGENDGLVANSSASGAVADPDADAGAGGLVGENGGQIQSSHASGKVGVQYDGGNTYAGGLAGYSDGDIDSSYATGAVSGDEDAYVGGLVGQNDGGTISNSHAGGHVSGDDEYGGGLVGYDEDGQIVASYATGAVTGTDDATLGGLVSYADYDNIENSHASGAVTATDDGVAGGLVGYLHRGNISGSHASGAVKVTYDSGTTNSAGGLVGYDYSEGYGAIDDSYATGAVSAAGAKAGAGGLIGIAYDYADIDNSYATGAVHAGNGGSGVNDYAGGLVGYAYQYTNISDSHASGAVTGDGYSFTGGLVGYIYDYDTLNNSYATGTATGYEAGGLVGYSYYYNFITDSHASGNVTGKDQAEGSDYVGGLIGYSSEGESILSDYASGIVNGGASNSDTYAGGLIGYADDEYPIESSHATGAVKGAYYAGGLVGYTDDEIQNSYATGAVNGYNYVGGLVGYSGADITGSYATGAVVGTYYVGGLIGDSDGGDIADSYATGKVMTVSNDDAEVGGLVGLNYSPISDSWASGNVSALPASDPYAGGLVGENFSGSIDQSFATGNVRAAGTAAQAGGLVGNNDSGEYSEVYATGSVTGDGTATSGAYFGGLVGENDNGTITRAYSLGEVSGTGSGLTGGLVGYNDGGTVSAGYWDTQTSGLATSDGGVGLTTAALQSGLPSGFSSVNWKFIPGVSFPYLAWQFGGATPRVISGKISGGTTVSGLHVGILVGGSTVTPVVAMTSGANGYYYELLAPGTIGKKGSDVLAYVEGGDANSVYENAKGSLTGFNLGIGDLIVISGAANETKLLAGLKAALGSNSGSTFLFDSAGAFTSGIDLDLDLGAANFTVNDAIDIGSGTLTLDAAGGVSQDSGDTITAATLTGHSVGATTLGRANDIAMLDGFASGGNFVLNDAASLTVNGAVNAASGNLTLTTKGSGHNIAITKRLTAKTVKLVSAGKISESGSGAIDATTLTGSSVGATTLSRANVIADLGAFATGNGGFALTDDHALTTTGTVNTGSGPLKITTGSGDKLAIDSLLKTTGTMTLVSGADVTENASGGAIDAHKLNVSAQTGIQLTSPNNDIAMLGTDTTVSGSNKIKGVQ